MSSGIEPVAPTGAEVTTVFVAIEISRTSRVVGIRSPQGEKMGLHAPHAADVAGLRGLIEERRLQGGAGAGPGRGRAGGALKGPMAGQRRGKPHCNVAHTSHGALFACRDEVVDQTAVTGRRVPFDFGLRRVTKVPFARWNENPDSSCTHDALATIKADGARDCHPLACA